MIVVVAEDVKFEDSISFPGVTALEEFEDVVRFPGSTSIVMLFADDEFEPPDKSMLPKPTTSLQETLLVTSVYEEQLLNFSPFLTNPRTALPFRIRNCFLTPETRLMTNL